jgi:hypothetical protein
MTEPSSLRHEAMQSDAEQEECHVRLRYRFHAQCTMPRSGDEATLFRLAELEAARHRLNDDHE